MRVAKAAGGAAEKVEPAMTPMIDVVFQLLIFFMLSLKIVTPEGDFQIKMPLAGGQTSAVTELPPAKVRIVATASGAVDTIRLGDRSLGRDFRALRTQIRSLVGDGTGPGANSPLEVEFDCDYRLDYAYAVEAIDAVSGYTQDGAAHRLVERIRFAPPRRP